MFRYHEGKLRKKLRICIQYQTPKKRLPIVLRNKLPKCRTLDASLGKFCFVVPTRCLWHKEQDCELQDKRDLRGFRYEGQTAVL